MSTATKIYTHSDSYCGNYMTGALIPSELKKVYGFPLVLEKHVIIGAGSIILPGVKLGEGVAIGSNSLVIKDCDAWGIYAGSPAKRIKERSKKVLELEQQLS
jgi:galactoside O-acetyltransferase